MGRLLPWTAWLLVLDGSREPSVGSARACVRARSRVCACVRLPQRRRAYAKPLPVKALQGLLFTPPPVIRGGSREGGAHMMSWYMCAE